jgi:superfamily II DNA or RNA helicase
MSLIRRPISPQIRVKAEPIDIADRLSRDTSPATSSDSDSDSDSDSEEPPELRIYQEEAVKAVLKTIKEGIRRIGVSAPTGAGKTIIFASIIKEC